MLFTFSISCDFLQWFWRKWSIFCSGLDQAKRFYTLHAANFIDLLKANFAKRTPRLFVGVKMELRQNIPRRFIEEKNTNLRRCLRAAFVWYFCKRCFRVERFFFSIYGKCREKSVQCLINRICKFVTSENFSVEKHFCIITPILFCHRKCF